MAKLSPQDDFDPRASLQELSDNINQPDRFAEKFCAAAKSQKKIDDTLKETVKHILLTDQDAKVWIGQNIKEQNRKDFFAVLRKITFAGWTLIIFLAGTIFTAVSNAISMKFFK